MMRESLANKCDLFANNYNVLSKKFKWNNSINTRLGALLYTMENREADIEAIERCRKIIKENTGVFSQFKDTTNFMSSVMLSLQPDPEPMFKSVLNVYDAMKHEGFHSSPYLVLAAISVALQADPYNYQRIILSAKNYYDAMKEEHKFITSSDDYGFAALLAMSDKPVHQAVKEMEDCYRILKGDFFGANAVQALSHVLTFSEEPAYAKCRRVAELDRALKDRKCKIGSGIELSFLGVIALLQEDTRKVADEISMVKDYLKSKKGFGGWSISNTERIMFAVAVVCDEYLTDAKRDVKGHVLVNSISGILIAQQMAVMAAASGAAAATSAN
ncbi:MAG: hypothetical protein K0R34_2434 [Herbinix sp.]|nr:hypothetical protein [Herbinix sp.]